MQVHEIPHTPEPLPANEQLGEDYRQFKTAEHIEPAIIQRAVQAICRCPIDIRGFYAEHRSLEDLRASGIGAKIKYDLLAILENGIEKALLDKKRANQSVVVEEPSLDVDLRRAEITVQREERRLVE